MCRNWASIHPNTIKREGSFEGGVEDERVEGVVGVDGAGR